MFAKFKTWLRSKFCKPEYNAAEIRSDLSDIINDIEGDTVEFNQAKFDAVMQELFWDHPEHSKATFLNASEMNAWLYGNKGKK